MRTARLFWCVWLVAACSGGGVTHVGAPDVTLWPSPVVFENGWVGLTQSVTVTVTNRSPVKADLEVLVTGPFATDLQTVSLGGSAAGSLVVTYRPALSGHHVGSLQVGHTRVVLLGDARTPPDCVSTACVESTFDTLSRSCATKWKGDGTPCTTSCNRGTCQAGVCTGVFATCDDFNACTVDTCNEASGCGHLPRDCPKPADPCQVATCNASTGCGATDAPDGTACGTNLCSDNQEQVCIGGQCVSRPRPPGTRCGDTWLAAYDVLQRGSPTAFDSDRRVLVTTSGAEGLFTGSTWEWNATTWYPPLDVAATGPSGSGAMAYDAQRKRVLYLAADYRYGGTWEYDGAGWTLRSPAHQPPARQWGTLYFNLSTQTVWLFGGDGWAMTAYVSYTDLWEWTGTDWIDRTPASSPPMRLTPAVAYDEGRHRLVLFGGGNGTQVMNDTWEFDGTQWAQKFPVHAPPAGNETRLSYDALRGVSVLVDRVGLVVWEWDGTDWQAHSYTDGPGFTWYPPLQLYDPLYAQVALFTADSFDGGFSADWHWDGAHWTPVDPLPSERMYAGLAYDSARKRTVLFGGRNDETVFGDTWEFDGKRWSLSPNTAAVPPRSEAAMVYDPARQQVVLFGGADADGTALDDTWAYDGAQWVQLQPAHLPPRRLSAAAAYDSQHRQVVIFGGVTTSDGPLGDTWAFDGTDWSELTTANAPLARWGSRMVYDELHQQLVLFSGATSGYSPQQVLFPEPLADTWTFDGTDWLERDGGTAPSARYDHAMTYDPVRHQVMLCCGMVDNFGGFPYAETWQWDGQGWAQRSPLIPAPGVAGMALVYDAAHDELVGFGGDGRPQVGRNETWLFIPP